MEWIEALNGGVVGLDTAPIIYFIEENPVYFQHVRSFFEAADRDNFEIVTSMLTLTEVLVHPLRRGNPELAVRYREMLLNSRHISIIPVADQVAEKAASLRATHGLRTPDAIQLSTAVCSGACAFLTNDHDLPAVVGVRFLVLNKLITPRTIT